MAERFPPESGGVDLPVSKADGGTGSTDGVFQELFGWETEVTSTGTTTLTSANKTYQQGSGTCTFVLPAGSTMGKHFFCIGNVSNPSDNATVTLQTQGTDVLRGQSSNTLVMLAGESTIVFPYFNGTIWVWHLLSYKQRTETIATGLSAYTLGPVQVVFTLHATPTVTLPSGAGYAFKFYWIKHRGAGTATVDTGAGGGIMQMDGTLAQTMTIGPQESIFIYCSSNQQWRVLAHSYPTLPISRGGTGNTIGALPDGTKVTVTANNFQLLTSTSSIVNVAFAGATADPDIFLPTIASSIGKEFVIDFTANATGTIEVRHHSSDGSAVVASSIFSLPKFRVVNNGTAWVRSAPTQNSQGSYFEDGVNGPGYYFTMNSSALVSSNFQVESASYLKGEVKTNDHLVLNGTGSGIKVESTAANCRIGQATLASGTVTVANTTVTANTQVQYFRVSGTAASTGVITVTRVADTSFTLTSSNGADDSVYEWFLVEKI